MRTCRECGRYLPSLASQRAGIGPKCRVKVRRRLAAGFKQIQRGKATRALRGRGVTRFTRDVYRVRSGDNTYLASESACNCASGRYRGKADGCWHVLAVKEKKV